MNTDIFLPFNQLVYNIFFTDLIASLSDGCLQSCLTKITIELCNVPKAIHTVVAVSKHRKLDYSGRNSNEGERVEKILCMKGLMRLFLVTRKEFPPQVALFLVPFSIPAKK